jgi:hypothetical protein
VDIGTEGVSRENRLASGLDRVMGTQTSVSPDELFLATANHGGKVRGYFVSSQNRVGLPIEQFLEREGINSTTLHEIRHAYIHHRLVNGESSQFFGRVVANNSVTPISYQLLGKGYSKYLSFDELSTNALQSRVLTGQIQRAATPEARADLLKYLSRQSDLASDLADATRDVATEGLEVLKANPSSIRFLEKELGTGSGTKRVTYAEIPLRDSKVRIPLSTDELAPLYDRAHDFDWAMSDDGLLVQAPSAQAVEANQAIQQALRRHLVLLKRRASQLKNDFGKIHDLAEQAKGGAGDLDALNAAASRARARTIEH